MRTLTRVLTAAVVALALVGAAEPPKPSGLYAAGFRFRDDSGREVELASLRGRNVVLTMFYSTCTTKCPMTLKKLKEIETAFAERKEPADFVLVSFDSRSDSPDALRRYRKRQKLDEERWHLLTGSSTTVRALADRIGLGGFLDLGDHMVHSYRIVRLDPDGTVIAAIDWQHPEIAPLLAATRH